MRSVHSILCAVLLLVPAGASAEEAIGVIKRSKGPVVIERGGTHIPVTSGAPLYRGDRVVTGRGAYANVRLRGASPLNVGSETSILVDRFVPEEKIAAPKAIAPFMHGIASLVTGASRH